MATGAIMVAVAIAMLADLDIRFQTAIADDLPAVLVNPSKELEETARVRDELASIRGDTGKSPIRVRESTEGPKLPELGAAPDFTGNQMWFNTPDGRKLSLRELRGKVVLVDFWTYTCINCIRTLPHLKAWDERYRDDGLVIVGVHTPEFPFERDADNVADAIGQSGLRYAVAQDNDYATWNAYGNQYWPAKYLIDAEGQVRYRTSARARYDKTETAIRRLLEEAGRRPGARARATAERASKLVSTPESYLGAERADRFVNGPLEAGTRTFTLPDRELPPDTLGYAGTWRIGPDSATAASGARLELAFGARRVFLVLGSRGAQPRPVRVSLDGRPLPDRLAGEDVRGGRVVVRRQRLYRLVDLRGPGRHKLTLDFAPGVSGYAFTFG